MDGNAVLTVGVAAALVSCFIAGGGSVMFFFSRFTKHDDFSRLVEKLDELVDTLNKHKLDIGEMYLRKTTFTSVIAEFRVDATRSRDEMHQRLTRLENRLLAALGGGRRDRDDADAD